MHDGLFHLLQLLGTATAVALVARRFRIPYATALVLAALALGSLNVLPDLRLDADVVLRLFLPMPVAAAVWGAMAGDLTSILPVHGVAGAGTYEAGVVAGLLPFGVAAQPALQAAVNLHIFLLGATLLGGALGFLINGRVRAAHTAESERWM